MPELYVSYIQITANETQITEIKARCKKRRKLKAKGEKRRLVSVGKIISRGVPISSNLRECIHKSHRRVL